MLNLDKKTLVIITAIIVLVIFIAQRPNTQISEPNNELGSELNSAPTTKLQPLATKNTVTEPTNQQQTSINNTKSTQVTKSDPKQEQEQCITQNTFNQDPRHQIIANYIKNDYLAGEVDYINYLNNTELEQLAHSQNIKAMYILGINYQWNAIYKGDRSERFRPQEIEKQPIKVRQEFNLESWQKAQYWLEKAAANGQVSALIDIAVGYQQQAYLVEEKGEHSDKVVQHIKQNAIAYMQLHQQLAPELSQQAEIDTLVAQLGEPDPARFKLLKNRWKKERENLGLSEHLELNLPPELAEINQLRTKLCP